MMFRRALLAAVLASSFVAAAAEYALDYTERPSRAAAAKAVDPDSAAAIHKNNVKRVIRALEIFECCGTPKSVLDKQSRERGMLYDACVIGLRYHSRERLYARIDQRVDMMLEDGLYDEVVRLRAEGIFEQNATAAQAIGYKELLGYLDGRESLAEAVESLKRATRRYAKRQITWFGAKDYVKWIDMTEDGCVLSLDCAKKRALASIS